MEAQVTTYTSTPIPHSDAAYVQAVSSEQYENGIFVDIVVLRSGAAIVIVELDGVRHVEVVEARWMAETVIQELGIKELGKEMSR